MAVTAFPRSRSEIKTTRLLELVHADIMGPMSQQSQGGTLFVLLFVDDFSRYVSVFFLKTKSEVVQHFRDYKVTIETQTAVHMMKIRTDNGRSS